MHCKCYIIGSDGILFSVVAGAVLRLNQGRVVEREGGSGVTEEAQNIEGGKGGSSAVSRTSTNIEEGLANDLGVRKLFFWDENEVVKQVRKLLPLLRQVSQLKMQYESG